MTRSAGKFGLSFSQVLGRIKEATGARTQVELAEILGIRQSSISDAKRRSSIPSDWFLKLFRQYGLNPDWLAEDKGPRYLKTKEGYQVFDEPLLSEAVREDAAGFGDPLAVGKTVTFYAMAGEPSNEHGWKPGAVGKISIPKTFDRPSLLVVGMDGAGMEPLIKRGAYIGLDRDQKSVLSGEIYGVHVPYEGLVICRVYFESEKGRVLLRSENMSHPDRYFSFDEYADKIVGRVIWVVQEL
ncbi:MAG: S24 family peptidase [Thermodesulfobacteriota bacterium]|nr:S24 family peptidase [Thermodesulfobacteriota bacterium]